MLEYNNTEEEMPPRGLLVFIAPNKRFRMYFESNINFQQKENPWNFNMI